MIHHPWIHTYIFLCFISNYDERHQAKTVICINQKTLFFNEQPGNRCHAVSQSIKKIKLDSINTKSI